MLVTMPDVSDDLGFAPAWDAPVPYMQRTRDWYEKLGYGGPYRWAHYLSVPFHPLEKSLSETRVTIITTAAPFRPDKGDQGPGAPYNAAAKFYEVYSKPTAEDPDLRVSHVGIDRANTSATDSRTWFPLIALRAALSAGRVGSIAERFHGAPTNRSQRHTLAVDAPEILSRCQNDGVEAAILVPNCPVCHQSISLIARYLEENGISTVIAGAAKDIVEHCGVPRFLFSDFPLGNSVGRPEDPDSQAATLELALSVLEEAPGPRTTVQNPMRWNGPAEWRLGYMNVDQLTADDLARLRAENDVVKETARHIRESTIHA